MPSETVYFPAEDREYVGEVKDKHGLENVSQAVQKIVREHREGTNE